jgi:transcription termination factor Rho
MAVLERPELEASPLSDLHAIADQIGLDGFRRLRKADLIDAILGEPAGSGGGSKSDDEQDADAPAAGVRKRRPPRLRRGAKAPDSDTDAERDDERSDHDSEDAEPEKAAASRPRRARSRSTSSAGSRDEDSGEDSAPRSRGSRGEGSSRRGAGRSQPDRGQDEKDKDGSGRTAEGVVEVLGNGSAFLRVDPPEPSDDDVYISAAQVRRCELVSGDKVSGPVRTPRRSERYPSLVRIDTINGTSADAVSDGARYEDLPVAWPSERLTLDSKDKTLEAIEWLTPLGKGSRATIVGGRCAGKSETLRSLYEALKGRKELELSVVLTGVRPEEIAQWQEGDEPPTAALSFAASADSQSQALERALDAAKRVAARGGDAMVLIDGLDGVNQHTARKALAAARNLKDGGSLTVIATASQPIGGETTVIALDPVLASTGRQPILDLVSSGTLKAELLVGETDAKAITKARAEALENAG